MNAREKPLFRRIQACLDGIANMAPSNPCDVARKCIAADRIDRAEAVLAQRAALIADHQRREQERGGRAI